MSWGRPDGNVLRGNVRNLRKYYGYLSVDRPGPSRGLIGRREESTAAPFSDGTRRRVESRVAYILDDVNDPLM